MKNQQKGNILFNLFFIFLLVFFGMMVVKIVPAYFTHNKVNKVIQDLPRLLELSEAENSTRLGFKDNVKTILSKNFQIQGIYNTNIDEVTFAKAADNQAEVSLHTAYRSHLFYNIDIIIEFDDSVLVPLK